MLTKSREKSFGLKLMIFQTGLFGCEDGDAKGGMENLGMRLFIFFVGPPFFSSLAVKYFLKKKGGFCPIRLDDLDLI